MTDAQQRKTPGAWPWGKGRETHQEPDDSSTNAPPAYSEGKSDDTSKMVNEVKDSATDAKNIPDRTKGDDIKDTKSSANGKVSKTAKDTKDTTEKTAKDTKDTAEKTAKGAKDSTEKTAKGAKDSTDKTAKDAKDTTDKATKDASNPEITEEPSKIGDDAKEATEDNDDDEGSLTMPKGERLKEVDPDAFDDEMKAKLTPGKDFDINKFTSKKPDEATKDVKDTAEDTAKEGEDLPKKGEDVSKEGEDVSKDVPKEGEDVSKDVPKEGEKSLEEGKDSLKDGESKPEELAEGTKDGVDVPKEGEDALKEGEEGLKEGQEPLKEGEEAAKDATVGDDVPKEGEEALKEGEEIPKEGEEALKEGQEGVDVPKEGEEALKEGEEGAEVPKEGEEALKEGEEGVDVPKEGEEALKEGDEGVDVPKEGEEALKEGEEAPKEGEEALAESEEGAEGKTEPVDLSILKNGKVNKGGNVVDEDGKVVGRIVSGVLAHLVGKKVDEEGQIWNDNGKVIGKAELIPDDEREGLTKEAAPFESFPDAVVDGEGYVVFNDERIGKVVDGDIKKLRGMKVDQDGDILDRAGNVVGKAERWEPEKEPEKEPEAPVDRSILAGKRVNKGGYLVDGSGTIFGRVVEGDPKRMVGRMANKNGEILSESGDIIGRAEVVPEGEREGQKEGPFAELEGCTVRKDGMVITPGGDVVGRLTQGDGKVLFGRPVDEDGDVVDKNGNVLGKAERYSEPEVEKKKGPMAGRRVNREGNVVDEDGNLIGKLTTGELSICAGKEIDDDGDVFDGKGTVIGHVSLLQDIKEPEESAEDKEKRETAEKDKKLAQQMAYCLTQCLDKVKPICSMISSKIEAAERQPKEELDEEQLVKEVRPLIEEGGKILQEANGIIRGLDPDGRIQANAKHKTATREATPEEYHLADILKELAGTVSTTIDNAKKKIEGMPHAKKELNPLWGLLAEPLGQILAAVGLLLTGVLGLVGQLLSGLGLGGLVDGLLGGLGIKNILKGLGVGSLTDALTGQGKGKKKGGGLLGLGG